MTSHFTLITVILISALLNAHSYSSYQARIPNGNKVKDGDGELWPGVGHLNRGGGGARNSFGLDFVSEGKRWTSSLCSKDSDGDGLTNGQELGDPDCVWSEGDIPQFDTGITHPGIASTEEVERAVLTCTDDFEIPTRDQASTKKVNLTFPEYRVPGKGTTYAKFAFNMQTVLKTENLAVDQGSYFGIRFGVVNKNPEIVHHMILYGCDKAPKGDVLNHPSESSSMECQKLRYAWAVGGNDFCMPKGVGIEFSVAEFSKAWHILEIHYDNPKGLTNVVDASGLHVQFARRLDDATSLAQFTPAGFMWIGFSPGQMDPIPPRREVHHVSATCSFPSIPPRGVKAFAYINHAHLLGRKLWTTLERDGKYVGDVGCDTAYDFDLQQFKSFANPVQIYSSDKLTANCVYDSSERTKPTRGGDETENEMCINFVVYYPEIPEMERCLTSPQHKGGTGRIMSGTGAGQHVCCSPSNQSTQPSCKKIDYGAQESVPGWLVAHLLCMAVAWVCLLPAGIFIAASGRKDLFKWHIYLQCLGVVIATIGTVVAFLNLPEHADTPHKILGICVMVLAWMQPIGGFLRPHKPELGAQKPLRRKVFEFVHKGSGRVSYIMAAVNVGLAGVVLRRTYLLRSLSILAYALCGIAFSLCAFYAWILLRRRFKNKHFQDLNAESQKHVELA